MISISKLYCDRSTWGDTLRYETPFAERKPIVVWNCTRRCNLKCVHCYSQSCNEQYEGELSNGEAREMIRDLAAFGAPVLLFSGGEPLMRQDLFELGAYARELGHAAGDLHQRHADHEVRRGEDQGDRLRVCRDKPGWSGGDQRYVSGSRARSTRRCGALRTA